MTKLVGKKSKMVINLINLNETIYIHLTTIDFQIWVTGFKNKCTLHSVEFGRHSSNNRQY